MAELQWCETRRGNVACGHYGAELNAGLLLWIDIIISGGNITSCLWLIPIGLLFKMAVWQSGDRETRAAQVSAQKKKKKYPTGRSCGCLGDVKTQSENWGLEDIELLQLERRKYIWLAWVSPVPGELLYKSGKRFSDMKWGARQVGRSCWFGAEREGSSPGWSTEDTATSLYMHSMCHYGVFLHLTSCQSNDGYAINNGAGTWFMELSQSHIRRLQMTGTKILSWLSEWEDWKRRMRVSEGAWFYTPTLRLIDSEQVKACRKRKGQKSHQLTQAHATAVCLFPSYIFRSDGLFEERCSQAEDCGQLSSELCAQRLSKSCGLSE